MSASGRKWTVSALSLHSIQPTAEVLSVEVRSVEPLESEALGGSGIEPSYQLPKLKTCGRSNVAPGRQAPAGRYPAEAVVRANLSFDNDLYRGLYSPGFSAQLVLGPA